ncbi:MAG TPA: hypothetical protein VII16_14300, partial [Actinomycetes bacterium]
MAQQDRSDASATTAPVSQHAAEHAEIERRHVEDHERISQKHLAAHGDLYAKHGAEHALLADR